MVREETIFTAAVAKGSAEEQAAYLDEACADDARLRQNVEALLAAHRQAGGVLETPPLGPDGADPADHASEGVGSTVGPYKLLEQIGGGGMGVVYMAEQVRPVRRKVALKIIKPGMDSGQVIARFEAERQALTMMDHPNIARVLDAGTTDAGRPYFVMELVKGVPITDYCDGARLNTRQRLELFVLVCNAVQHAHQKGIIHRDLKPGNILVTLHDERPVPKVIDFGIAKGTGPQLTELTLFTHYSQMLGTPLYMSPEQAQISGLDVDTRSDVYSLGVVLYELLTGTTPFDKQRLREAAFDEMRRIIREEDPPTPSTRLGTMGANLSVVSSRRQTHPKKLGQSVRGELDWIVMKALEKDRDRRYESPSVLAADVRRFLNDEPVQACPPSAWYRWGKFARRNKVALVGTAALAAAVVLAVVGLATSTYLISREQRATEAALDAEKVAKRDLQRTVESERQESNFRRIALAQRELAADNLAGVEELLEECPREARQWEWGYLKRLCEVEPVVLHDSGEVHAVAFGPGGRLVVAGCEDHTVKVWDVKSRKVIQTLPGHDGFVFSVAFSPDGRYVASAGADRLVRLWERATGAEVFRRPGHLGDYAGTANGIAFSPDGRRLVAGGEDGIATVWDVPTGSVALRLPEKHENTAVCVAFSPDGLLLATGSWGGVVRIWDTSTGKLVRRIDAHNHRLSAVLFHPDGRRLASASFDRTVKVWDVATGERLNTFHNPRGLVSGLAYSHGGERLFAAGGEGKTIKVWDPRTDREVLTLRGHSLFCHSLAASPDGLCLASAGKDGTIRIWDGSPVTAGEAPQVLTLQHGHEVWSVEFSADGRYLASASWGEQSVRVWDAHTWALLRTLNLPPNTMNLFHLDFSPDGNRLVTTAASREREALVNVFDTATGRQVPDEIREKGSITFCAAFDPTGRYLVREGPGHTVQVRDAATGEVKGVIGRHDLQIWAVTFSPDGRQLATASNDGTVRLWLWDLARLDREQRPLRTFPVRVDGYGNRVAFGFGGHTLATGGEGFAVQVWDTETQSPPRTLTAHTEDVFAVAFSPDGRWLASAGADTTVRIWEVATWKLRHTLRGHTSLVMTLGFSPDSRSLASGSRDHLMKVWDTTQWGDAPPPAQIPPQPD
jgi:WD40 repeat protein/serine/threonine protein kinase